MPAAPLTDPQVKSLKPKAAPFKRGDGQGMFLLVKPDGGKYWRLKYRFAGKEKTLALGVYPDVTLKDARGKRDEARSLLAQGKDPAAERRADKRQRRYLAENTFEAIAREWHAKQRAGWSPAHATAVLDRLEKDVFPMLGREPIALITAPMVLDVLRKVEKRGALELLAKTRVVTGQVFRYAIGGGRAVSDPTRDLRGQFEVPDKRHYARLAESDLPEFLVRLDQYDGSVITRLAMRLLVLTFVRTGELRGAQWPEFNFAKHEWRVPAERMKNRIEHIVPLSRQAVADLKELQDLTGGETFLFPNEHRPRRPMSENTILFALYRMGYRGRATGHGFRATASTILNEHGIDADVIERQLAHKEANETRAAYHHSQYLTERRKMMQWWGDFLDEKRQEGIKKAAKRSA